MTCTTGGIDLAGEMQTTAWELLAATQADDAATRREAIETFARQYWKPIYVYLRAKGHPEHEASDLTQGFFADVVLERDLIGRADRRQGRFRSLLYTALENFARDEHRRSQARRRRPAAGLVSMDAAETQFIAMHREGEPADRAFVRAWVAQLLDAALQQCRAACAADGLAVHWRLFERRIVEPLRDGGAAPSYQALCEQHDLATMKQAANMVLTVRRRFAEIIRRRLRQMVDDDSQIDQELAQLMAELQRDTTGVRRR